MTSETIWTLSILIHINIQGHKDDQSNNDEWSVYDIKGMNITKLILYDISCI